MAGHTTKSFRDPDERITFPGITEDIVDIGGFTVGRVVQEPGWRWSKDLRPIVGGEWCQARHTGMVLSGRFGSVLQDGTTLEFGPEDVYDLPPGHDGYTIGDEPAVLIEWSGLRAIAGRLAGHRDAVLATLLFTDIVDSTAIAARMGDAAWREALARHYGAVRAELERFGGREVDTTGDGVLSMFDSPVAALRCAAAIRAAAAGHELRVRVGVHVGQVQLVGSDVQGIAVHEAARIMAAAGADEIMVSETVRALSVGAGLRFEDRGEHELKGLPDARRLYAFAGE